MEAIGHHWPRRYKGAAQAGFLQSGQLDTGAWCIQVSAEIQVVKRVSTGCTCSTLRQTLKDISQDTV